MPPTILIVDDEPSIADALAYTLRTEGFATDCRGLGRDALAALVDDRYALVILDVGLPDLSGFDVCRELRRRSDVPVIFLTARSEEIDRIVGLELGADDYVSKPFSPREVASRVRAILRRTRPAAQDATAAPGAGTSTTSAASATATPTAPGQPRVAPFEIDADGARIAYHGIWLSLTRYEYRLLATLLQAPGRILSRAQLMDMVWRDAEDSMERTVDAHIKTLRGKLRAVREASPPRDARSASDSGDSGDTADPIETHRGLGYSLRRCAP